MKAIIFDGMPENQIVPQLRFQGSQLRFRYPFRIAHGQRTSTDVVLVKLHFEGHFGLGEATLPPYLGWTTAQVMERLALCTIEMNLELTQPSWTAHTAALEGCWPAIAAIDMAVWNLAASLRNTSIAALLEIPHQPVEHTFTLGISDLNEMREKLQFGQASGFSLFKLKMDGHDDRRVWENFRSLTDAPFAVDANQGWTYNQSSLEFAMQLQADGCQLIEQPYSKIDHRSHFELSELLDIPVIADESVQVLGDMEACQFAYDGFNIKLQKCGGLTGALPMIDRCKALDKKILIGCMSESSIGCGVGEQIAPLASWADLDGPWLISNDPEILELALNM